MIEYINNSLFKEDSVEKEVRIIFDDGLTLTNSDLYEQEMSLTEILCDAEQLQFGMSNASELTFSVGDVNTRFKGKWFNVVMYVGGDMLNPLTIGRYKVESDKPDADRTYRQIVAYDALYDVINADVKEWYNTMFATKTSYTLKEFRTSFFNHFGITEEPTTLANDNMTIVKTIEPKKLSGRDVIYAICELNGAFGHITRYNNFRYVRLTPIEDKALFPSDELFPSNNLYPQNAGNIYPTATRISCSFEEYLVERIDGIQIKGSEDDIGAIYGTCSNPFIVQENFLCYGKTAAELQTICANLYPVINNLWYRPFEGTFVGNPCVEVGDSLMTVGYNSNTVIRGYVLERTLDGIQALTDTFTCRGNEHREEQLNGVQSDIQQLRGRTNELTRTVDETRSYLEDKNGNLIKSSEILQTATDINISVQQEVQRAQGVEAQLQSAINVNANAINLKVSYSDVAQEVSSQLQIELDQITLNSNQIVFNGDFKIKSDGNFEITSGNSSVTSGYSNHTSEYGLAISNGTKTAYVTPSGVTMNYGGSYHNLIKSGSYLDVGDTKGSVPMRIWSSTRPVVWIGGYRYELAVTDDIPSGGGSSSGSDYPYGLAEKRTATYGDYYSLTYGAYGNSNYIPTVDWVVNYVATH